MKGKVKPSQELSKTIDQLLTGAHSSEELLSELLRLGAQRILQETAEAEVDEFLGRGWYERGSKQAAHRGYRNGYTPLSLRTTQGPIQLQRPRVRGNEEPFESAILSRVARLEDRLVRLATEMYVRGLSTRDIEQTLTDGQGQPVLSRSLTSRLTELYAEFFEDLKARGLAHPLLVVSDGGKGIIKAIAECFPFADRGRCIAHKMRNLTNKLPKDKTITDPVKARVRAIYYAGDLETAQGLAKAFITDYAQKYPSMIKCFNDDLGACLVHLKYPYGHRRSIRTTNLIERSFAEQKRRTKVIPNHVNEKGAMKLVYGTLIRAAQRWQRVSMDEADLVLLKTLRKTMCKDQPVTITDDRISFKQAA